MSHSIIKSLKHRTAIIRYIYYRKRNEELSHLARLNDAWSDRIRGDSSRSKCNFRCPPYEDPWSGASPPITKTPCSTISLSAPIVSIWPTARGSPRSDTVTSRSVSTGRPTPFRTNISPHGLWIKEGDSNSREEGKNFQNYYIHNDTIHSITNLYWE